MEYFVWIAISRIGALGTILTVYKTISNFE
jgi:hypothetical protein